MKLKKIASLMLAGIMAVSMLAGCKSGSSNNNDDSSSNSDLVTSGVSAEFYDALSNDAKMYLDAGSDNANLNNAFNKAVSSISEKDVATQWSTSLTKINDFNADLTQALEATVTGMAFDASKKDEAKSVLVYAVGGGVSESRALEIVADALCVNSAVFGSSNLASNFAIEGNVGGIDYNFDYDVSASVISRTVTDNNTNKTVVYVAVMVSKTAEKA